MRRGNRIRIGLECSECGRRNYTVTKNKGTMPGKLALKKFCAACNRHTEHREGK